MDIGCIAYSYSMYIVYGENVTLFVLHYSECQYIKDHAPGLGIRWGTPILCIRTRSQTYLALFYKNVTILKILDHIMLFVNKE